MAKKDEIASPGPIPLKWVVPSELPMRYATNMFVQRLDHEYLLRFFEARPPVVIGSPAEQQRQLQEIGSVDTVCVAQVVMSPGRMHELLRLLQEHVLPEGE